jgi:hypothetical protein
MGFDAKQRYIRSVGFLFTTSIAILTLLSYTDPDTPRSRKLISEYYDEFEFPGDKEVFGELTMFIRRIQITKIPP